MAITASDIHNQSFSIDRKGYDVDEVDVFLEHVADEIDILNDTIAQLQAQLEEDRLPPRWPSPRRWLPRLTPPSTMPSSPRRTRSSPIWSASSTTSVPMTTPSPRPSSSPSAPLMRFSPRPMPTPRRLSRTPATRPSASSIAPTPTVRTSSTPFASCRTIARMRARSMPTC